jgi:hypothetical protein
MHLVCFCRDVDLLGVLPWLTFTPSCCHS